MLQARDGCAEAFARLVRRHRRTVIRAAIRHMGPDNGADDVVQETFAALHRYLPAYRPQGKLRALLLQILRNQARMAHRRRGRDRLVLIAPPDLGAPAVGAARLLEAERRRVVARAVDGLSDRYRNVIELRYYQELPYAEIGRALDVPVGTVKSRMFTALRRLRNLVAVGAADRSA